MQFNKTLMTAALLTVGGFTAMSANAADTSDFNITAKIDASCTIDATGANINFATVAADTELTDTTVTNKESSAGILVTCSKAAPYTINLKTASNPESTTGEGTMKGELTGNTDTITYQLNSNAAGTVPWGSLETNGVTGTGEGVSTAISHLVYATIKSTTDIKEDTYTDTITASVIY